jgi:ketosteroid isomerase-like protein
VSRENLDLVRRNIDAYNRRDIGDYLETVAEELVFHSQFGGVDARTYHGRAGAREYFQDLAEAWHDYRVQPQELLDAGDDRVVGLLCVTAEAERSGIKLERRLGTVFTVRAGRIVAIDGYTTRAEALEAAGLSEQDTHTTNEYDA